MDNEKNERFEEAGFNVRIRYMDKRIEIIPASYILNSEKTIVRKGVRHFDFDCPRPSLISCKRIIQEQQHKQIQCLTYVFDGKLSPKNFLRIEWSETK